MIYIFNAAIFMILMVVANDYKIPARGQIAILLIALLASVVAYAQGYLTGKKSVVWSLPSPQDMEDIIAARTERERKEQ